MIRKYILIMFMPFTVFMLVVSCKDSYPGLEYIHEENSNTETLVDIPVLAYINEPGLFFMRAGTRGAGAFTEDNAIIRRDNTKFNILAFRAVRDRQGPLTADADFRTTLVNDPDKADCLVDGSIVGGNGGMPSMLGKDGSGALMFVDGDNITLRLLYGNKYQDVGYNFFGYYLDDAKASISRTADNISYDIEIDGTQDVLCGYAPELTTSVLNGISYEGLQLSSEEKARLVSYGGYSAYSAKRDVNPVISLRHALTRLEFSLVPGDKTCEDVTIRDIRLRAVSGGRLVVASKELAEVGMTPASSMKTFYLHEQADGLNAGPLISESSVGYKLAWEEWMADYKDPSDRNPLKVGDGMMLVPAEKYELELEYDLVMHTGVGGNQIDRTVRQIVTYELNAPGNTTLNYDSITGTYRFMPGYKYDIMLVVYGTQPIVVLANVEGWTFGGDVDVDTEN